MRSVAPRILLDVSYVRRISHEIRFAWQAQYLLMLDCHFSWQVQHFPPSWRRILCGKIQHFPLRLSIKMSGNADPAEK